MPDTGIGRTADRRWSDEVRCGTPSHLTGRLGLVGLVLAGSGVKAGSFSAEQQ